LPAAQSTAPPATPPGISRTQLLDNPTVLVARLRFAPGAKEEPHTHPFSAVVVHLGPAKVDMLLGAERKTSDRDRGFAEFIAKKVTHASC
jgi:quercetin dioxygenase-like cupin family protein